MISKKSRLLPTSGGRLDDSAYSLYLLLNSGGKLDDFRKKSKIDHFYSFMSPSEHYKEENNEERY